jgi:hypothetical protein
VQERLVPVGEVANGVQVQARLAGVGQLDRDEWLIVRPSRDLREQGKAGDCRLGAHVSVTGTADRRDLRETTEDLRRVLWIDWWCAV